MFQSLRLEEAAWYLNFAVPQSRKPYDASSFSSSLAAKCSSISKASGLYDHILSPILFSIAILEASYADTVASLVLDLFVNPFVKSNLKPSNLNSLIQ